ncbi:MAG: PAS domain S-box protein [Negativicutes bacterium]|nr:PAS domain S-box protein [Negativicutes bacterium]
MTETKKSLAFETNQYFAALHETALLLMKRLDLDELLKIIVVRAGELLGTNHGYIYMTDPAKERLTRKVSIGLLREKADPTRLWEEGLAGKVWARGETMWVEDYSHWGGRINHPHWDRVKSAIAVPLTVNNTVIGVLGLDYFDEPHHFSPQEPLLLSQFAQLASLAIANAQLYEAAQAEIAIRKQVETALLEKEQQLRNITDNIYDIVLKIDTSLFIEYISPTVQNILGYSPDEVIGEPVMEFIHPADVAQAEQSLQKLFTSGAVTNIEFRAINACGCEVWLEANGKTVPDAQKNISGAIIAARDITARKRAEERLRLSEEKFSKSFQFSAEALMITKLADGTIIDVNGAFERITGFHRSEILGRTTNELQLWPESAQRSALVQHLLTRGAVSNRELQFRIKSGELRTGLIAADIVQLNGEAYIVGVFHDMTERKEIEERLSYLSSHDYLTGLFNRAYFDERMRYLDKVNSVSCGIIVCDTDGLKLINDTLGHDKGDTLLILTAEALKYAASDKHTVARIGGDEFAILLPHATTSEVIAVCQKIKTYVDAYNQSTTGIHLSLSLGYAASGAVSANIYNLFKEADNNMYREKLHRSTSARSAIVQTVMKLLEARDFITEGHADRLQDLACDLGAALGLSERSLSDLRLLAQFHDIGKVGIPDHILFKPGRLTAEEAAVMRRHCEIGYQIAQSSPDLIAIAEGILKHHEWWNGLGYPIGLSGKNIPLECRILAIVDAYDAMTNDRPYRKAMPHFAAIAELKRCAGKQFDPDLVNKFIELRENRPVPFRQA